MTILLVGENVNYALQVSHYGYVMETGRITLEGPSAMLFDNDHVRKAYLGVSPEQSLSDHLPGSNPLAGAYRKKIVSQKMPGIQPGGLVPIKRPTTRN